MGYAVEWRVINAADYGMPQRRKRTYILAYRKGSSAIENWDNPSDWLLEDGIMARAFPISPEAEVPDTFKIQGTLAEISENFNKGKTQTPFKNSGLMIDRQVVTCATKACYNGPVLTLGDILLPEAKIPEEFFIPETEISRWTYLKGSKSERRVNKATGFEYNYTEGAMTFPDAVDRPSRTIITGEGGPGASRFKHVVKTSSGRLRRLVPIELERLNMFPDNHTAGSTDIRRAFLMGNALVTGIVERLGIELLSRISS